MAKRAPCIWLAFLVAAGCAERLPQAELRLRHLEADLAKSRRTPPPPSPLDLEMAVAYALEHNLALWATAQEREIQEEMVNRTRLDMLPGLVAEAEASRRSAPHAAYSEDVESGRKSSRATFSAEVEARRFDAAAVWHLLDFGLTFLRAQQAADRAAMAAERWNRARQTLVLDVIRAYWQAVVLRDISRHAAQRRQEIAAMLASVRTAVAEKALSEVEGLKREAPLLEQDARLRRHEAEYAEAVAALADLLGAPPGAWVEPKDETFPPTPAEAPDVAALCAEALRQRPELREKDLEQRISATEARAAIIRWLPSPSLFGRWDRDLDAYLYRHEWTTAGLRVAWDLLRLPHAIQDRRLALGQAELAARQRQALAAGILIQVHIAAMAYEAAWEQERMARQTADVRSKLAQAVAGMAKEGSANEAEVLDQNLRWLASRSQWLMAYANLMTSRARLLHSIGRNPLEAAELPCRSADDKAAEIAAGMRVPEPLAPPLAEEKP